MQAVKHWTYILQVHISIHIYQILLHDDKVKITKLYDCLENLLYIQQYWFISKTRFYQIRAYSWDSQILKIRMRHIFKYAYNPKHRWWTLEYTYTKCHNASNKMSFFLLSIALSITAEPIPRTIHTVCKSK